MGTVTTNLQKRVRFFILIYYLLTLVCVDSDFGRISPELHTVLQVGAMSMFIGAMYGGTVHSRESYLDFIKNNQATAFKSHLDAKVDTLCK